MVSPQALDRIDQRQSRNRLPDAFRRYDSGGGGEPDQMRIAARADLGFDLVAIVLDGFDPEIERRGDLIRRPAQSKQPRDLGFARPEILIQRAGGGLSAARRQLRVDIFA